MRRTSMIIVFLTAFASVQAQSMSYVPLDQRLDPGAAAFEQWDQARASRTVRSMRPDAQPQLAGLHPESVELLQDALLRKHPKLLKNSPGLARRLITRRYQSNLPQLRGIMAEALFLNDNPEWGYVAKANASQHDVYRWVAGKRTPFTGQIKIHKSGNPATYTRDMTRDYRAHRFFVPDDHVEDLKAYLKARTEDLAAAGKQHEARTAWRNYGRVRGIGRSFAEIDGATRDANRGVVAERSCRYVTLGASLALALGPIAWDFAGGDMHANQAAYRLARAGGILGVGAGTDALLAVAGRGTLRGTTRGNAIIGAAITITDATLQIYELGWNDALRAPEFYESIAGGISATAVGLGAGGMVAGATCELGPWVAGPAGFVAGTAAGTLAYFGGRSAIHALLEIYKPEMVRQYALTELGIARTAIENRIQTLQSWPPVLENTP